MTEQKMGVVNNQDIVGLYNRMNRFVVEMHMSVSGNTSQMNAFDQDRLESYLNAVDTYHDWIVGQPALDCPESHPTDYVLALTPDVTIVENENVNDVIRMMTMAREELINSQSARDAAGLSGFDSNRLRAITEKVRKFLNDYVKEATPLDMPESSPKALTAGQGNVGI